MCLPIFLVMVATLFSCTFGNVCDEMFTGWLIGHETSVSLGLGFSLCIMLVAFLRFCAVLGCNLFILWMFCTGQEIG